MGILGATLLFLFVAFPALAPAAEAPVISAIPDQTLVAGIASPAINFTVTDADSAASSIRVSATSRDPKLIPAEGIAIGLGRVGWTMRITPAANASGKTTVSVTATDGRLSGTQTFAVTVEAQNAAPSLSDLPDQLVPTGGSSGRLPFTIGDAQTDPTLLQVRVSHDNGALISQSGLVLAGAGPSRTLTVDPIPGAEGTAVVTVSVSDGLLTTSDTFRVTVSPFDFGDAPDVPYPTLRASSGAAHRIVKGYSLGAGNDAEPDGQPNSAASGEGAEDDGVVFVDPLAPGSAPRLTLRLAVPAGTSGAVDGWIDFDGDGKWNDAEEHVIHERFPPGDRSVTIAVPATARVGTTYARFRLSQEGAVGPGGLSTEAGEVEDYAVNVANPEANLDFADAPDTYRTVLASDGARHRLLRGFSLGKLLDADKDGQPTAGATGDDLNPTTADDEDGVTFAGALTAGQGAPVAVEATAAGRLDAWVDYNADGDFADAGERIFTALALAAGVNNLTFPVPATVKEGASLSRFRLSREGVKDYFGEAPDGEVEDHPVRLASAQVNLDFGDAPDPTFPTALKNNGARHRVNPDVFLGRRIDAETDGQPNAGATGDDVSPTGGTSDEDGVNVTVPLVPGQAGTVAVQASTQGLLSAWIDFNQDGDWADPGEEILANVPVVGGVNTLTFAVPSDAKAGSAFDRFRFSRFKIPGFTGEVEDGEVEDGTVRVSTPQVNLDFSDAPDPTYPTTLKNNGARHRVNPDVFLGRRIDAEGDGQPNAGASGDDASPVGGLDDEDGVEIKLPLVAGQNGEVIVTASTQGRLWAWVDFNADGDWSDEGERIFNGQLLAGGANNLNFPVPATAKAGPSFSRFRFTRVTIESFVGEAADGEVEDYPVRIAAPEARFDYGDAPEEGTTFPTTIARKGAHHQLEPGFRLGREEDVELDGQPDAASNGDDASPAAGPDDEDGVRFLTPLVPGSSATVEVLALAAGRLDAWIDFNLNRSWNDAGEKIFNAQPLVAGVNVLNFIVPTMQRGGVSYSRFRLSKEGGLGPEGFGGVGEVEDHLVRIDRPQPCELGCTGVDFWLAFPGNYAPDPANPVRPQLCVLGGPGTQVTIRIAGLGYNNVVNIPAAGSVNVLLPAAADLGDANDVIENKGVRVTATGPVTVHALSQVKHTSDGYTALSTEVVGTEYLVLGYGNLYTAVPELNGTQLALVATEDATKVTIVPSEVTGVHDSGFPYQIELNAGQTYQLRNTNDAPRDLTGTRILADKPVAVFSGHQIANVQSKDVFFADHLVEQLLPLNRWGTEFFARPFTTPAGNRGGYTVRVLAAQNNTRVFVNGVLVGTLQQGRHLDRHLSQAASISTDRPALMAQFAQSSDSDGVVNADPFMVLGQQRNLFNRDLRFCTAPGGFLTHHLNLIVPTASTGTVQIDGAAFAGPFAPIAGTGYSHATAQIGAGIHRVTCAQPIGVIVYGWNEYESYAWPACPFFGDTTPPQLTCPTEEITVQAGNVGDLFVIRCSAVVPDLRSQVKATDNCSLGSSTVGVIVQQEPAPGTRLGVGTHEIVLSVTDAQGNVGRCVVTFNVVDPNPDGPLTLQCPPDMTVACTTTNGAVVDYRVLAYRGCTPVPVQCTPPPGSFFPLGETTVTCVLEDDEEGESQTCTFKVTVQCRKTITIGVINRSPVLEWGAGAVLESAEQIQGPWTVVEGATPPFNVTPQGNRKFFRIRD